MTIELLQQVILDLCDGIYTVNELMNHTGLPETRCFDIMELLEEIKNTNKK